MKVNRLECRTISPAIATIGLISVAIAASIPAISQMQTQVHSAPDTYTVSIDIVKLTANRAWFYVSQSEAKNICVNMLQNSSTLDPVFCTSEKTFVITGDIAIEIGVRYSVRVDLYDTAGKVYAAKNVAVIAR